MELYLSYKSKSSIILRANSSKLSNTILNEAFLEIMFRYLKKIVKICACY